jgi:pimeloyl-ACP methyl ester carboxylesterase
MERATHYNKALFAPVLIEPDDIGKGVPVRTIWTRNMYRRLSYADRLGEVRVPSLIIAGRHDPKVSVQCSQELIQGVPDARLVVFEHSGHAPLIAETQLFTETIGMRMRGMER